MTSGTLFWLCIVALMFLVWVKHNNDKKLRQILQVVNSLMQDRINNKISEEKLQHLVALLETRKLHKKHLWRMVFFMSPKSLYPNEIRKRFE